MSTTDLSEAVIVPVRARLSGSPRSSLIRSELSLKSIPHSSKYFGKLIASPPLCPFGLSHDRWDTLFTLILFEMPLPTKVFR